MDLTPYQYLAPGQSARAGHECGDGKPVQVSRDGARLTAWCHRCRESWSLRLEETQEQRLARLRAWAVGDAAVQDTPAPPEPRVTDVGQWPELARVWLHRAGLSRADIGRIGAYYHAPSDRVVLPFTGYWLARAYPDPGKPGRFPKYLAPTVRPKSLILRYGPGTGPIVLVEDALSAIKVGKVADTWALLGTRMPPAYFTEILNSGRPVLTYLDPDPPGQAAALEIRQQLRRFGVQVRNVLSERDPKLYHTEEIRRYVGCDTASTTEVPATV